MADLYKIKNFHENLTLLIYLNYDIMFSFENVKQLLIVNSDFDRIEMI